MNKCKKKMDKKFKVIDDKSRPGYILYEDLSDGFKFWARITNREVEDRGKIVEYGHLTLQQLKISGHLKGYKTRKFSELSPEEQKIVMGDDSTEE
jgi:hypothetical protein